MKHYLLLTILILGITRFASADLGVMDASARPDTKFGPHYVLALDVSLNGISEEELCKTFPVDKDGTIQLLVGEMPIDKIAVVGLNAEQAKGKIKKAIAKYYSVDPDIRVGIAKIPRIKVTVSGATFRQGSAVLVEGARLQEALTENGYQPNADLQHITVNRLEKDGTRTTLLPDFSQAVEGSVDDRNNPVLQNGDVINLPITATPVVIKHVYVSGFVVKQGTFIWKPGMTMRDAMTEARGLLPTADGENITIVRRQTSWIKVNHNRVMQNVATDNVKLEEDDVIIVDRKDTGLRYSISGAVVSPQTFEFKGKPTLKQAITDCGGFRPEADTGKVILMRNALQDPNKSAAVQIDFDKVKSGAAPDIPLQAGDWVQVQPKKHGQSPLLQLGLFFLRRFLPF